MPLDGDTGEEAAALWGGSRADAACRGRCAWRHPGFQGHLMTIPPSALQLGLAALRSLWARSRVWV